MMTYRPTNLMAEVSRFMMPLQTPQQLLTYSCPKHGHDLASESLTYKMIFNQLWKTLVQSQLLKQLCQRTTCNRSALVFPGMLQSTRNSAAIFNQHVDDNCCEGYFAGDPTAAGGGSDYGPALLHTSAMRDFSVLENAQVDPLIDMVNWDASWENCAELFWNNQALSTSEQETSRQHELDWSL